MVSSNNCEMKVGRLLEVSVGAGYRSVGDVERMSALTLVQFGKLAVGERCVIAADWRSVGMMSPETAVRAREMLTASNPRVLRSAILTLPDRSLANLQVMRLVREAESDNRKHFTSAEDLRRWLSEVLTDRERVRLDEFLGLGATGLDSSRPNVPASLARDPER